MDLTILNGATMNIVKVNRSSTKGTILLAIIKILSKERENILEKNGNIKK